MQQIKSILIGWLETNDLIHSFIKFLGDRIDSMKAVSNLFLFQFTIEMKDWFYFAKSKIVGIQDVDLVQVPSKITVGIKIIVSHWKFEVDKNNLISVKTLS